jgi:hypothetical protein
MKILLVILSFFISFTFISSQSWGLPDCPLSGFKHNCFGTYKDTKLGKYIGEWKNNKAYGQGKFISLKGEVYKGE